MKHSHARAMNSYSKVTLDADMAYASPHRLIQMLFEGALEKIASAKGHMMRSQIAAKGRQISWAISIIGGLRASLDMKAGGEIAQNLESLYEYMTRRLFHANLNNDVAALDEVVVLLREIKSAWDVIPEDVQRSHEERKRAAAATSR